VSGIDSGMTDSPVPAATWCGAPIEHWRERWAVPELHIYRRVSSTNDVARERAAAGAPAGTVVIADVQTRGRGRRGRSWTTAPGAALLLSIVARPAHRAAERVLSLRIGLAVARAIETVVPVAVTIKWPNDLEIGGRKLAGVLCEGSIEAERMAFMVIGVGINLERSDHDWTADVRERATSLSDAAGRPVAVDALATAVVRALLGPAAGGRLGLDETERRELERRDALRGRLVSLEGAPAGRAIGVDPEGALLLQQTTHVRRVLAGTVRTLTEDPAEGP
jgi:BirA family biotin operon repressor/biotin-[acetyl-CoA-carboxylase] ligase